MYAKKISDNKQELTTDTVRKWIFYYGINSVLIVLSYLEQDERYEDCQVIKQAIESMPFYLPTRFDTDYMADCAISAAEITGGDPESIGKRWFMFAKNILANFVDDHGRI